MPNYIYKHPKKNKYVEVIQRMTEPHVYFDENGLEWERVFTVPQATVKQGIRHDDVNTFVNATKNMKGNVGEIHDLAEELSQKRANETDTGRDPVKDKAFDDWSNKRKGKKHPQDDRGR